MNNMSKSTVIDPIAQRKLTFGEESMLVQVARPESNGDDFVCLYSITSKSNEKFGHAMGMDSMQALQLALRSIEIDLNSLAQSSGKNITWLEDMPGHTGFSSLSN